MLTVEAARITQGGFELRADLTVRPDRVTAVIGPSGAGKSTLLSAIAGFVPLSAGRLMIEEVDHTQSKPADRPVSIVFQDGNLFPHLTVLQNVALGLRPSLRLPDPEIEAVRKAIQWVGLAGLEDRKPAALSGGQQSRVALARVLLRDTPFVLLDEPFAALGPALKREMLELVRRIQIEHGRSILMVTHDARDAEQFADEVIFVADQAVSPPVAASELFADPPDAFRAYLGT